MEHLMKLKVAERIHQNNPSVTKEELKKRFYKIEELSERNFFNLLMMMHKNKNNQEVPIKPYNNISLLKNYLIGNQYFLKNNKNQIPFLSKNSKKRKKLN